jgi:hypothetical protein
MGFELCRSLRAAGAQCQVTTSQKLDEQRTRVKTDSGPVKGYWKSRASAWLPQDSPFLTIAVGCGERLE